MMNNLWKQCVIVVDWCYMYKRNGEFVDNFLLHCEVACAVWNVFFSRFRLSWVMPMQVVDLHACWWTLATLGVLLCGTWCFCGAYGGK
jgi:hypothetical protein